MATMNTNAIGTAFGKRNESRYADNLKNLFDVLDSVSFDIRTTKNDFAELSERSRDNGKALEDLMIEIRGVREDDGVSKKLTGLAQLERLDQLDQLSKLEKLGKLEKLAKLDSIDTMQLELASIMKNLKSVSNPSKPIHDSETILKLKQDIETLLTAQPKSVEKLDNLEKLIKDKQTLETSLEERLTGLLKKQDEGGLKQQKSIESLIEEVSLTKSITERNHKDVVQSIASLLKQITEQNENNDKRVQSETNSDNTVQEDIKVIKSLLETKSDNKVQDEIKSLKSSLESKSDDKIQEEIKAIKSLLESRSENLEVTRNVQTEINAIKQILETSESKEPSNNDSGLAKSVQGDVRAILDHLLGVHKQTMAEIDELRQLKLEIKDFDYLKRQKTEIESEITDLKTERRQLQENCGELKADIKSGVLRLQDCEDRYMRLESQLREMAISKYKGLLGTSALAVLSNNTTNVNNNANGKSELVVKKRQLRTVSLAE